MTPKHFLFVLLALIALTMLVQGSCDIYGRCWKTRETPTRRVDAHICGDRLWIAYKNICGYTTQSHETSPNARRTSKSTIVQGNNAAKTFHNSRITKRQYTLVEECCAEGCLAEEVQEYCW